MLEPSPSRRPTEYAAHAPAAPPCLGADNYLPSEEGFAALDAVRTGTGARQASDTAALAWRRLRASAFTAAKCRVGDVSWRGLLRARRRALLASSGQSRKPQPLGLMVMHAGRATNNPTVFFTI